MEKKMETTILGLGLVLCIITNSKGSGMFVFVLGLAVEC